MTTEANKARARRFIDEVVNRGNVAVIDELAGPNYVDHTAPPGIPPTADGQKAFVTMFRPPSRTSITRSMTRSRRETAWCSETRPTER